MELIEKDSVLLGRVTGKIFVLIMGIVFIIGFILMNTVFPDYFMTQSNGNAYVDTHIFYASELGGILQSYGDAGRECYVKLSILYDFIFPLQYSLFFASCLILTLKKYLSLKLQKAVLLLGGVLCLSDWIENIFIITAIMRFPNIGVLHILAQIMTLLKSALFIIFLLAIFFGIVVIVVNKIKNRK